MSDSLYWGCKNWTQGSPSPVMKGSLYVAIISVFHSFFKEQKLNNCQLKHVYDIIKCLEDLTHISWDGNMSYEKKEWLLLEWQGLN